MEVANPIHPFAAMLISRFRGTCLIGFSFNFICIAEGKAKIDGMFLFGKTKRIERVPEGNHFLCRPKTAPTSDVDQAASPITHCTHTGSLPSNPLSLSALFAHYRHFVSLRSLSLPDCFAWTCCRCPKTRAQPGWEKVEKIWYLTY